MIEIVEALLDAQAANDAQDRALFNPSPEIDSALEHAIYMRRTATADQQPHADALVNHLRNIHRLNTAERDHERRAAGALTGAEPITSVHEFARLTRPLLGDLVNPIIPQRVKAERIGELHVLFGRAAGRTRNAFSLRPLLGVAKYTELLEQVEFWDALRDVECGP